MNLKIMHPADQICMVMKRIYDQDLTTLTGGNLSLMDEEGVMWVSPTNVDKSKLTRDDIVQIYPDGKIVGKHKPTSEYRIHRSILVERPGIKAVIHAHPPALVTMSVLHDISETRLYPAAYEAAGRVGLAEYGMPGSLELVECVMDVFRKGYNTSILKNHGVFLGSPQDLFDAFRRFEEFDFNARLQLNAPTIGTAKLLSEEVLKSSGYPAEPQMQDFTPEFRKTKEKDLRKELSAIAQRAYRKRLFTGFQGVISARVDKDRFIISPLERDNAYIMPEDFVLIESGRKESGMVPDTTVKLHQSIYERHPDINSVIVATPVFAMTFAVTATNYEVTLIPECYGVLRSCMRYPFSGAKDWGAVAEGLSLNNPFAIIENYGIVLAGPNPLLAFDKLEVCEFSAQSIHAARIIGRPMKVMTQEQIDEMDRQDN